MTGCAVRQDAVRIGTAVAAVFIVLSVGGAVVGEIMYRLHERRQRAALRQWDDEP